MEKVERRKEEGADWGKLLIGREKERSNRWERIIQSRYNISYGVIKGEGISNYLKKGMKINGGGWPDSGRSAK